MSKSYLPTRDPDLVPWLTNYVGYAGSHSASIGLSVGQTEEVQDATVAFTEALAHAETAKAVAKAAVDRKDQLRDAVVQIVRAQVREIQAHPTTTDQDRLALGITVHDGSRTPGAAPAERAEVKVTVVGQEHRIEVLDASNNRAARPADARGIELYRATVTPGQPLPSSIDLMALVGTFSTSRFALTYPGADIGKTVVYIARYVGTKNQPGPAGNLTTASVAA